MTSSSATLFHICDQAEADRFEQSKLANQSKQANQGYTAPDQDVVGFMHLSTADLLLIPANKYYLGRTDLALLVIDQSLLNSELRWEPGVPAEGELLFPHLYGPLNVDAVTQVISFPCDADGRFSLPEQLVGFRS